MRYSRLLNYLSIFLISISIISCEQWIDTEINQDPNSATDVTMELLIPSIQTCMAYNLGGNNSAVLTGIWMRYFIMLGRTSYSSADYYMAPYNSQLGNELWNESYSNAGIDIYTLIEKASGKALNGDLLSIYTRGMAKVMMAELMAFITNLWDDVPYSEAFLGYKGIDNPCLDSQEDIYIEIDKLLAEAIEDLSSESSVTYISGDMIFNGDEKMWLATAYALRARYSLILSKVNSNAYLDAINYAIEALNHGFPGYVFDGFIENAMHPIAQYTDERAGDLEMCSVLIDFLVEDSDPRLLIYSTDTFGATSPGERGSEPGEYVAAPDAKVYHMNLAELHFILAEAYLETNNSELAYENFINGVKASVKDVVVDTTGVGLPLNLPDKASLTLYDIIYQKYLANYGTVQAFNDWRRTGYPILTLPPNLIGYVDNIPRRYMYPEDEELYNINVSNEYIFITDRVWWDAL